CTVFVGPGSDACGVAAGRSGGAASAAGAGAATGAASGASGGAAGTARAGPDACARAGSAAFAADPRRSRARSQANKLGGTAAAPTAEITVRILTGPA